jgi:2-keto-4-pentenoate hydratase
MLRHARPTLAALAALILSSPGFAADCPPQATVDKMVRAIVQGEQLAPDLGVTDIDTAACGRARVVEKLQETFGRPIGYKAAVTGDGAKKLFGFDEPILGVLLEKMLVPSGSRIPAGAFTVFEGDLILEVGSEAINEAKTPLEVLAATRAIRPFMEIARGTIAAPPPKVGAPNFTLANAFAFGGVVGDPLVLEATEENVQRLADMRVSLIDAAGNELHAAPGSAILGQPLNAVIWIAESLARTGGRLKPGDMLSLGSITRLIPVKPDMKVRVRYEGLPGTPEVAAEFLP